MSLAPAVITTFIGTISATIGKISKPLAKTIIAIVVEYAPRAQAEAEIKRAVAKVAPYAVGVVSSALAFAIASVGMKSQIRGGLKLGSAEFMIEGTGKKPRKKAKPVQKKRDGKALKDATSPATSALRLPALPK